MVACLLYLINGPERVGWLVCTFRGHSRGEGWSGDGGALREFRAYDSGPKWKVRMSCGRCAR